ncbi:MAG TPA: precorrin-2 C(20)-methyltransferase [Victivallales bacterium]|nr:precorrin-2 C(20)-methyltransferase [Victivallales bacterium]
MKTGIFYGIGVGPGDPELITVKAINILEKVDIIFHAVSRQSTQSTSGSVIDSLDNISAERQELIFAMTKNSSDKKKYIAKNTGYIHKKLKSGLNCAFTTIGDPLTYSTYGYIIKELIKLDPELEIKTIPGVNSWSALCAASNTILTEDQEQLCIIPSYVNPKDDRFDNILQDRQSTVFLKTYRTRNNIIEKIRKQSQEFSITYGSNIGCENQFISNDLEEILPRDNEYLSMLIVKKKNQSEKK